MSFVATGVIGSNIRRFLTSPCINYTCRVATQYFHASCVVATVKVSEVTHVDDRMTRVIWKDKQTCDYPHIFLRDNCQCSTCFHPDSKQRLIDTVKNIDLRIQPNHVTYDEISDEIVVTWPDKHISKFRNEWLKERRFPKENETIKSTIFEDVNRITWNSKYILENMPFISFDELMEKDEMIVQHAKNLLSLGLSIIKNSPKESGVIHKMAERMSYGYIRKTHYGEIFTVKNKASPNNLAYTAGYLPLHVDLPFLEHQPGIQLLHCIEQSQGETSGVNHLTDGFRAAEQLKKEYPEYYKVLSTVKFKYNDEGADLYGTFNQQFERPIIGLDNFDVVQSISHNNHVRSSFVNAPSSDVYRSYEAYYTFVDILYAEILEYKMCPGDILVFNNKRVLHGRTPYDPTTTNRWLEGSYLDWDEVGSKYRVTKKKITK